MIESRRRMRQRAALAAAAGITALAGLGVASAWWPPKMSPTHPAPAAVVALSSGVEDDSSLDASGAGRLRVAAREAALHGVPLYTTRFVSAAGISTDSGQARVLAAVGYRGEWKVVGAAVGNTRDEAVAVRAALPRSASVEVVTSAMHARRACATFAGAGLAVLCEARYADPRWYRRPFDQMYELAATIKYRWRGWLS